MKTIVADTDHGGCARDPTAPQPTHHRCGRQDAVQPGTITAAAVRCAALPGRAGSQALCGWCGSSLQRPSPTSLGAIPTGLLVGRLYGGIDVRNYGSRSTGATNVLRTLGPGASVCVAAADFLKGLLAVLLIRQLYPQQHWTHGLAAFSAAVGHNWPLFARISRRQGRADCAWRSHAAAIRRRHMSFLASVRSYSGGHGMPLSRHSAARWWPRWVL